MRVREITQKDHSPKDTTLTIYPYQNAARSSWVHTIFNRFEMRTDLKTNPIQVNKLVRKRAQQTHACVRVSPVFVWAAATAVGIQVNVFCFYDFKYSMRDNNYRLYRMDKRTFLWDWPLWLLTSSLLAVRCFVPNPSPTGLLALIPLPSFFSNTNSEDRDSEPSVYSVEVSMLLPVSQLYAVRCPVE